MIRPLLTQAHQRFELRAEAARAERRTGPASPRYSWAPLRYVSRQRHQVDSVLPDTLWFRRADVLFGDGTNEKNGRIDAALTRARERLGSSFQSLAARVPALGYVVWMGPLLGAACGSLVRTTCAALGLLLKMSARLTLLGASVLTGGRFPKFSSKHVDLPGFAEQLTDAQRAFQKLRRETPVSRVVDIDFARSVVSKDLHVTLSEGARLFPWIPATQQTLPEFSPAAHLEAMDRVAASWSDLFDGSPTTAFSASYFAAPAMFERLFETANWSRSQPMNADAFFYSWVGATQTLTLELNAARRVKAMRLCLTLNQEASFDGSISRALLSPLKIELVGDSAGCLSKARLEAI